MPEPHVVVHDDKLSPNFLRYLQRREQRLKEETVGAVNAALERWYAEHRGEAAILRALQELGRRIDSLKAYVDARFDQHAAKARAAAKYKPADRGHPRDLSGRLDDPLLRALAHKKIDLGLTQQELADELEVNRKTLSHWLNRHWAPRGAEYDRVKKWVDEMEGVFEAEFRAMRGLRK